MKRNDTRSETINNRFERNDGKRPSLANLFCNYCKKPGHSIEKRYRLYGFPPNNKYKGTRRTAALVQTNGQEGASSMNDCYNSLNSNSVAVPGLTPEQSTQLIALLNNVQLNKGGYNSGVQNQEPDYNLVSRTALEYFRMPQICPDFSKVCSRGFSKFLEGSTQLHTCVENLRYLYRIFWMNNINRWINYISTIH